LIHLPSGSSHHQKEKDIFPALMAPEFGDHGSDECGSPAEKPIVMAAHDDHLSVASSQSKRIIVVIRAICEPFSSTCKMNKNTGTSATERTILLTC